MPERDAAERGVALRERGAVRGRQARARRQQAAQRAVDVRAAYGGAALDDREPVGREDERRDLRPQLLGRAQRRAVHGCALRRTGAERDLELDRDRRRAPTAQRHPGGALAEADQLRVGARARREALRADVQRLEQVRLAGAVRPDDEHEPRLEVEVEPGVRAEVAERDVRDDQPGRPSRRAGSA